MLKCQDMIAKVKETLDKVKEKEWWKGCQFVI